MIRNRVEIASETDQGFFFRIFIIGYSFAYKEGMIAYQVIGNHFTLDMGGATHDQGWGNDLTFGDTQSKRFKLIDIAPGMVAAIDRRLSLVGGHDVHDELTALHDQVMTETGYTDKTGGDRRIEGCGTAPGRRHDVLPSFE
jgi:hypothetical protein